jgi:hypothetical protein
VKVNAYFRKSIGLGFDIYSGDDTWNGAAMADIYLGPLCIEMEWDGDGADYATAANPMTGECKHSWSNWSAPETVEIQAYSMFGGDTPKNPVEAIIQTRYCFHCNIHQLGRIR